MAVRYWQRPFGPSDSLYERLHLLVGQPNRITAAQRWKNHEPVCRFIMVCAMRLIQLSSIPFDHPTSERHPFSVSSGCHNAPVDVEPAALPNTTTGLEAIFRAHGPGLVKYFQRRVGPEEACDLAQDVFTRAAGSEQRNDLVNPGGFLRRIAQNLLIDRSRKLARNNAIMLPLVEAMDAPVPAEQEHELHAKDLLEAFELAVRTMPEKTRQVFLMHRIDELSYREIHERLGISMATVEYHMVKALAHLAKVVGYRK